MSRKWAHNRLSEDASPPFPSKPCNLPVKLADGVTVKNVTVCYHITLKLCYDGQQLDYTGWFYPMALSQNFILGYEALTTACFPLFVRVIKHHHELYLQRLLAVGSYPALDNISHMDQLAQDPVLGSVDSRVIHRALCTIAALKEATAPVAVPKPSKPPKPPPPSRQEDAIAQEQAKQLFDDPKVSVGDIIAPFVEGRPQAPEELEIPDPTSFSPDIWLDVPTPFPECRPEVNPFPADAPLPVHALGSLAVPPQHLTPIGVTASVPSYSEMDVNYDRLLPVCVLTQADEDECAFVNAMYAECHMDMAHISDDYEERSAKYDEQIDQQVHNDFPEITEKFRELLRRPETRSVFVPREWEGLSHPDGRTREHHIEWMARPAPRYVPAIRVKPHHLDVVKKEYDHLRNIRYWDLSTSNCVSPMLVAPKATTPFIRLVCDYSWLRPYMSVPAQPIPRVRDELDRIKAGDPRQQGAPFRCFAEFDLAAAFHQLKIDRESAFYLAVSTPWGVVEPRFLPEGIPAATAILQRAVTDIFKDMAHTMIVLFDNLVVMGTSPQDLYTKVEQLFAICRANNAYLKLSKSNLSVKSLDFFGYRCDAQGVQLVDDRVAKVQQIPFPGDLDKSPKDKRTLMQSYLGSANFFNGFVHPSYAERTAPLYNTTAKNFDWDPATWKGVDYRAIFEDHKRLLAENYRVHYPDHSLQWILRTDASRIGAGAVLYQVDTVDGRTVNQPIALLTRKMSETAQRWNPMQLEAFAIYWAITSLRYLLRGKRFLLQTDHRNLKWMEKATDPMVMRMVANLMTFDFLVEHIPGRINLMADLLSRMYPDATRPELLAAAMAMALDYDADLVLQAVSDAYLSQASTGAASEQQPVVASIDLVHGGVAGHPGVARTWFLLNKRFPDHKYTLTEVKDFIAECVTCQKVRPYRHASLPVLQRALPGDHARHIVAIDTAELPLTSRGNRYVLVIHNLFTKYTHLVPMVDKSALASASALVSFFLTFGLCDLLHSDRGSDFTSAIHESITKWLGMGRTFALTSRPQADGVEPSVREVKRHLQALDVDLDMKDDWDRPEYIGLVQLMLNEVPHTQTNVSPLTATFGSEDAGYFVLPNNITQASHAYVVDLSQRLATLRAKSHAFQSSLKEKRTTPNPTGYFPRYSPGQYVLVMLESMDKNHQLSPRNTGPFEVLSHKVGSNLVSLRSLITGACTEHHAGRLRVFIGTPEQAHEAAQKEQRQVTIERILEYKGDVLKRSTCSFYVKFTDGDCVWKTYDQDLATTRQFEEFCQQHSYRALRLLLLSAAAVTKMMKAARLPIPSSVIGAKFFLNLRWWTGWYDDQNLPDLYSTNYYVAAVYGDIKRTAGREYPHLVEISCPIYPFAKRHFVDMFFVEYFGSVDVLSPGDVLVTAELRDQHKLV
jgi:transposase InsO family protein